MLPVAGRIPPSWTVSTSATALTPSSSSSSSMSTAISASSNPNSSSTKTVSEMKAEYFPPREDVILKNGAPTDFYILVTGSVVRACWVSGTGPETRERQDDGLLSQRRAVETSSRETPLRWGAVSAPDIDYEVQWYNWYFVVMIARKKKAALHHSAALFINS
ncbi:uncharacterized protein A4U43_C02F7230 [Asparagus officinalis]|uniref:Uncharacterized protein n=1 Tax=Asparagus officinalis TaxID=4686 RepID=A0A5P1FLE9_ASPOF|nr:uncharacterized protein A4U43_C02F7230 [Asparagus officinalis]